jgi:hypothetical protein
MRKALQKALQHKNPLAIDLSPIKKLPSAVVGPSSDKKNS